MKKILFVCTGNTCRSPMAQALFSKMLESSTSLQEIEAVSCGLSALYGLPASREAIKAMMLEGLDLSGHRSCRVNRDAVMEADLILTMTREHCQYLLDNFPEKAGSIFTIAQYAGEEELEVNDPFGQGEESYLECAREIKRLLSKIIFNLTNKE